jgi:hypothetical protein
MSDDERKQLAMRMEFLRRDIEAASKRVRKSAWRSGRSFVIFAGGLIVSPVTGGFSAALAFLGFVDMADNFQDLADAQQAIDASEREIHRIRKILEDA